MRGPPDVIRCHPFRFRGANRDAMGAYTSGDANFAAKVRHHDCFVLARNATERQLYRRLEATCRYLANNCLGKAQFAWCQAVDPQKDLSKRTGVGIADLPCGTLDRLLAELQQFQRLRHPQPLGIIGCSQPSGV